MYSVLSTYIVYPSEIASLLPLNPSFVYRSASTGLFQRRQVALPTFAHLVREKIIRTGTSV
ncbi:hypothetical protein LZ31DRAFT_551426 [Colletotrichum somersetense]|nr:hypothetical protein LZ31DRAFT_551426 [Colletotrichum somersetense]